MVIEQALPMSLLCARLGAICVGLVSVKSAPPASCRPPFGQKTCRWCGGAYGSFRVYNVTYTFSWMEVRGTCMSPVWYVSATTTAFFVYDMKVVIVSHSRHNTIGHGNDS
ncbi:hypothetical protein M404DRAFT_484950 [Pisolithus tinctorius Marx 270]|uniref:Secreted protein n=1 Tax=Pisolithus tinctorius Marx 270 TaxID=870435 RepID=A0A0C3JBQ2_PISTI|nr:hypothetical protein M404DRAFT_484950 [Pisolithus tinctorius Marx 270]